MKTLYYSILNEFLKLKRTPALYLSLIGAGLIQFLFFGIRFFKTKYFIPAEGVNPWIGFIQKSFMASSFLLLPLFIILITSLLVQTEFKAKAWKQLLVMPVKKEVLFVSKFITIIGLLFFTFILFNVLLVLNGYLLGWIRPELNFSLFAPDYNLLFKISSKLILVSLSLVCIQYWLSIFIKNFIIPLGIGLVGLITGLILISWKKIVYFPYMHHYLEMSEMTNKMNINHLGPISVLELTGLIVAVLAFVGSFIHFKMKPVLH